MSCLRFSYCKYSIFMTVMLRGIVDHAFGKMIRFFEQQIAERHLPLPCVFAITLQLRRRKRLSSFEFKVHSVVSFFAHQIRERPERAASLR